MQELRKDATVILIIDSCFSGTITRDLYVQQEEIAKYHEYEKGASRQYNQAVEDLEVIR